MAADEEALITAVMRVRLGGADMAAACHAALQAEGGFEEVTLAQVKKASSKAAKRSGGLPAAAPTKEAAVPAAPTPLGTFPRAMTTRRSSRPPRVVVSRRVGVIS